MKIDFRSVKEGNPFGTTQERDEMNIILADLKKQCEELNMKNESLSKKNKKVLKENAEYKKNFESAINTANDLDKRYASLLGYNYPDSKWYKYSYNLINKTEKQNSLFKKMKISV